MSALLLAGSAACGGEGEGASGVAELPLLTVSEPTLEIGVLDGAEEYVFGSIESVVRLGDGTIAVSDPASTRISVYGTDGSFVRSWGREGDGPGEFRSLSRLYPLGRDSLMAAERYLGRVSVYDLGGTLSRQVPATELSADSLFVLDSWLYGRFWVEGALTAKERARVRATLDRLSPPRLDPGYRAVRVDRDGRLWAREPGAADAPTTTWTRLSPDGTPEAVVTTPSAFRPTDIEDDEILGVWTGEADVAFVRAYRLVDAGETRPVPAWLTGSESAVTAEAPPSEEELLGLMRGSIRSLARAQEIHYSTEMSYTTSVAALGDAFEPPAEIRIDFVHGDARGWAAVFTHPLFDRVCALAYGFNSPPGWTPGSVLCGPAASGGAEGFQPPSGSGADAPASGG